MTNIFKYKITALDQNIKIPKGAEILSVGVQKGEIMIWALVDVKEVAEELITRKFLVTGTGWDVSSFKEDKESDFIFIGTVFIDVYVFHVFDLGEK